jgi:hypothetical protein
MSKKYNFAFDVSALSDYTNENTGLVAESVYKAVTIGTGIEVLPAQKGSNVKLNTLSHDIALQAAACGWSVDGTTTFNQVPVSVAAIDLKEALCPKTLEPKYLGQLMANGSSPEDFPFSQYVIETKQEALASQIDYMFWQGDTTGGSGNLALVDGVGSFLESYTSSVVYVDFGATISVSNVEDKVDAMVAEIPEEIYDRDDLALYMPVGDFKLLVSAYIKNNYYNYNTSENGKTLETTIPGHNIKVYGVPGLRGTHNWYLTPTSNLVFVTDLLDETEDIDMWFSKDNDEIRLKGSLKMGVGVYFSSYVVSNNPNLA